MAADFSVALDWSEVRREHEAALLDETGDPADAVRARGYRGGGAAILRLAEKRTRVREEFRLFFERWDVLLAPIVLGPAFPHETRAMADRKATVDGATFPYLRHTVFPSLASLTGHPATAFPAGFTAAGLPVGLQAIGPHRGDFTTIRVAGELAHELCAYRAPPGFE